jgi:hypothetical protein
MLLRIFMRLLEDRFSVDALVPSSCSTSGEPTLKLEVLSSPSIGSRPCLRFSTPLGLAGLSGVAGLLDSIPEAARLTLLCGERPEGDTSSPTGLSGSSDSKETDALFGLAGEKGCVDFGLAGGSAALAIDEEAGLYGGGPRNPLFAQQT